MSRLLTPKQPKRLIKITMQGHIYTAGEGHEGPVARKTVIADAYDARSIRRAVYGPRGTINHGDFCPDQILSIEDLMLHGGKEGK